MAMARRLFLAAVGLLLLVVNVAADENYWDLWRQKMKDFAPNCYWRCVDTCLAEYAWWWVRPLQKTWCYFTWCFYNQPPTCRWVVESPLCTDYTCLWESGSPWFDNRWPLPPW